LAPLIRAGLVFAVIAALSAPLGAREYRSREMTWEFQREHPCPSTGLPSGAGPGYRKDHVEPLACGDSGETVLAVSGASISTVRKQTGIQILAHDGPSRAQIVTTDKSKETWWTNSYLPSTAPASVAKGGAQGK
jgi:hypothetical protein